MKVCRDGCASGPRPAARYFPRSARLRSAPKSSSCCQGPSSKCSFHLSERRRASSQATSETRLTLLGSLATDTIAGAHLPRSPAVSEGAGQHWLSAVVTDRSIATAHSRFARRSNAARLRCGRGRRGNRLNIQRALPELIRSQLGQFRFDLHRRWSAAHKRCDNLTFRPWSDD